MYAEVADAAPNALIVATGYPYLFEPPAGGDPSATIIKLAEHPTEIVCYEAGEGGVIAARARHSDTRALLWMHDQRMTHQVHSRSYGGLSVSRSQSSNALGQCATHYYAGSLVPISSHWGPPIVVEYRPWTRGALASVALGYVTLLLPKPHPKQIIVRALLQAPHEVVQVIPNCDEPAAQAVTFARCESHHQVCAA